MTLLCTEQAQCHCVHAGTVTFDPIQDWVTVDDIPVLVKGDFDGRSVAHCIGGAEAAGIKRCRAIATVNDSKSHSQFVAIEGLGIALDSASGATDYMNVNLSPWHVASAGQNWIAIVEG